MEITSFVLGMLTIIALLIVTAIVVGMVKINQLKNKTENLTQSFVTTEYNLRQTIEALYREVEDKNQNALRVIEDINQDITTVKRNIISRIDETKSYIDSRIDRVVAKETLESSKNK
jgi:predicted Holliday junction resolvase-like endonuclease